MKPTRNRQRRLSISAECISLSFKHGTEEKTLSEQDKAYGTERDSETSSCSEEGIDNISDHLRSCLNGSFLFTDLNRFQKDLFCNALRKHKVLAGEYIVRADQRVARFFVIAHGTCAVLKLVDSQQQRTLEYGIGDFFGQEALMYDCSSEVDIVALTKVDVYSITRERFRTIMCETESQRKQTYQRLLLQSSIAELISPGDEISIADVLKEEEFPRGTEMVREGVVFQETMRFYLIIEGEAQAYISLLPPGATSTRKTQQQLQRRQTDQPTSQKDKAEHQGTGGGEMNSQNSTRRVRISVGVFRKGDIFGERALLTRTARRATIVAETKMVCASLDFASFIRLLGHKQFNLAKYGKINHGCINNFLNTHEPSDTKPLCRIEATDLLRRVFHALKSHTEESRRVSSCGETGETPAIIDKNQEMTPEKQVNETFFGVGTMILSNVYRSVRLMLSEMPHSFLLGYLSGVTLGFAFGFILYRDIRFHVVVRTSANAASDRATM